MPHLTRRALTGSIAALAALPARAQAPARLRTASLRTGISVIISEYLANHRVDHTHGIDLDFADSYPSLANYYNDFINGTLEVAIGSWDVFADMAHRGVPVRMLCTVSTARLVSLLSDDPAVTDTPQLAGRTIAATQSAGSTRMTAAVIADRYKLRFGKEIDIQNAAGPGQAITLLLAGSVAGALSWEPDVSIGITQKPALHPVFNLGDSYHAQTGDTLPYFGYAIRAEALARAPGIAAGLNATFADICHGIMADQPAAIAAAAPKMRVPPAAVRAAFDSGRLSFDYLDMTAPTGQAILRKAGTYMHAHGAMEADIGDNFFA